MLDSSSQTRSQELEEFGLPVCHRSSLVEAFVERETSPMAHCSADGRCSLELSSSTSYLCSASAATKNPSCSLVGLFKYPAMTAPRYSGHVREIWPQMHSALKSPCDSFRGHRPPCGLYPRQPALSTSSHLLSSEPALARPSKCSGS